MEVTARLRNLRMGPRKVRLLADLVRGRDVAQAIDMLEFQAKRAAKPLQKLLRSAVADADHNFKLEREGLRIKRITVDQAVTLKRFTPKAFGRAAEIRKRGSHVTVTLEGLTKRKSGSVDKAAEPAVVEAEAAPVAPTTKRPAATATSTIKGSRATPKATGRRLFSRKTG